MDVRLILFAVVMLVVVAIGVMVQDFYKQEK